MRTPEQYDVVGIGFGPGNLALAIAFEELVPQASVRFVEAQQMPIWQGAMLLDGSDIQHHPCRDLVTLRNPRSRYTFLNYLLEEGRLVEHLNLPLHFPLRKEYARYIRWATEQFRDRVYLGERVVDVSIVGDGGHKLFEVRTNTDRRLRGRSLCVGTGRTPHLPAPFDEAQGPRVFHSSQYLYRLRGLPAPPRRIAVYGGSQSAVEVTLDLARRFPDAEVELLTRAPGLALKDTSPFSEKGYFPEFVDYYYRASRSAKRALDEYMRRTNYSSVDEDILHRLYVLMYEQGLDDRRRVFLRTNRRTVEVQQTPEMVRLVVEEIHLHSTESIDVDLVIVATGYRDLGPEPHQERYPPLLEGVISRFKMDDGYLRVNADYTLEPHEEFAPPLVLNGLCESSHGIGDAGSFSLLSLRARIIMDGLQARGIVVGAPGCVVAGTGSNTTDNRSITPPVRRRAADLCINLRSNELIHPDAARVLRRAAERVDPDHLRAYPAIAERMEALAGYFGRKASDCIVTPGSDAAIRLICDAFARRGGRTLLLQAPNYDAWEQAAQLRGLSVRAFCAPDACTERQLTELVEAATGCRDTLIAVSTPNGPVGGIAPPELLDRLGEESERNGHLLVLDGCYQSFAGPHDALLPRVGERTLVVHSLSKSHGLAGARVGLVFGTRERLEELDAWPTEQAVSASSLLAAEVVIKDHETFCRIWAEIRDARANADTRLREWGASPLPSGGNFLAVRVGTAAEAAAVTERIAEAGYRIRDLSPLPGLGGCIRFTVGDWDTTNAFLSVLRAAIPRGG